MNWDDLRIALAVHKSGSYAAAAAELRIDETTVSRRLARLQQELGFPLFEAVDGVRKPTARCEAMLAHAAQFAQQVERLGEEKGGGESLVGNLRIAATDSVAVEVLAPRLPAFLLENPGIKLRILTSTENVNFSRWQADLAIRLAQPEKGDFTITKLADFSIYAIAPAGGGEDLVCAYPEDLDATPESTHLASLGLLDRARCVTKNVVVMQRMLRSGNCRAVLPGYMCGDFLEDPNFKATRLDQTRGAWLLVQDHLKQDPAVRAVIDWLRVCFSALP